MPENEMKLTEADIRRIVKETAKEAASEAVEEIFARLGVDVGAPFESQRDFQHLRQWRQSVETVKRQGLLTAIGVITVGVLALIWQSVRNGTGGP